MASLSAFVVIFAHKGGHSNCGNFVIVNEITFMISFSENSFLVYRKASDFFLCFCIILLTNFV
jgi:hypothetical protein